MKQEALGLIETVGLAPAVEGADAALKAANVRLLGYELTRGGGMVTIKITGDVSAVQAAIAAGVLAASRVGKVVSKLVIPRPHEDLEKLIHSPEMVGEKKPLPQTGEKETAAEEQEKLVEQDQHVAEMGPAGTVAGPEAPRVEDNATAANGEAKGAAGREAVPVEPGEGVPKAAGEAQQAWARPEEYTKPVRRAADQDKPPTTKVCNLCGDPACPRRKGEPRSRCIHYAE